MLIETTVNKLQEMWLSSMARAFKGQLADSNMASLSFEDRFGLLVDYEWIKYNSVFPLTLIPYYIKRRISTIITKRCISVLHLRWLSC